ncbi:hypothetical protein ACFHYQ_22370 [Sphaerimonospora cavernae]|uniref:FtsX-like permease family protein n=1 Tax=Sphaerimonospora cavernae TaxID=1740611 RepID=A0ABV6UA50_9ACTN
MTGAAIMTASLLFCLMVVAVYSGWDQREAARGAEPVKNKKDPAIVLYSEGGDAVGTVPHSVIYVEPLSPSAPPPPGLPRWPRPGEAFLSPELIRAGQAEKITGRYGTFGGTIGSEGLASPGERLAYVRPIVDHHREWLRIARIGSSKAMPIGDSLNRVPIGQFLSTLAITLGGAALVLLVVAARVGSATRDRRTQLLAALGGTGWHRTLVTVGEALPAVILGTVLGALPYLAMMTVTTRLPISGFVVSPSDLRTWSWAVPLMMSAACLIALLVVASLHRIRLDGRTTRPRTFAVEVPRWRLVAGLAGLFLVIVTPYLPKVAGFLSYIGGTALLWGMLPSAAGVAVRWMGERVARFGLRGGRGVALVAGRWAHARPGVVVRLVAVIVIGLGVITQAQVWTSRLGDAGQNAEFLQQRLGDSVLLVTAPSLTPEKIRSFRDKLPSESELFAFYRPEDPTKPTVVRTDCAAIREIGLSCDEPPMQLSNGDLRARVLDGSIGLGSSATTLRQGDIYRGTASTDGLAIISPLRTEAAPLWQVKIAAHQAFGRAHVERPFDAWLLGADRLVSMADWIRLLTVLILAILLITVVFSSAAEFLVFTASVAPLAVLTEQRRFLMRIALWNLTLPALLAVVIGVAVAAWQGNFFIAISGSGTFSWDITAAGTAAAVVLAVGLGLAGGIGAVRAADRWRPAAD